MSALNVLHFARRRRRALEFRIMDARDIFGPYKVQLSETAQADDFEVFICGQDRNVAVAVVLALRQAHDEHAPSFRASRGGTDMSLAQTGLRNAQPLFRSQWRRKAAEGQRCWDGDKAAVVSTASFLSLVEEVK